LRINGPEYEVDHSHQSAHKENNGGAKSLLPPHVLITWPLIKHVDNFILHCESVMFFYLMSKRLCGSVVFEAVNCKSEGHRMENRRGEFSNYLILPAALGPEVRSASMSTRSRKMFLRGKARPVPRADNLTAICKPIV
jgi:hypothetical protein